MTMPCIQRGRLPCTLNLGVPTWVLGILGAWAFTLATPNTTHGHRFLHTISRTNVVPPTVTAGTPDPGGRYFGQIPEASRVRRYYIAAEWSTWDFAPGNRDPLCGTSPINRNPGERLQSRKIRYIQYQDETFQARSYRPERLGILGPVLRGVVGDYLVVTFLNRTDRPLSMHPHGVSYDKDSEGAYYNPKPGLGAAVGPKARFTYVWKLDGGSGPSPKGPSSRAWLYHSHVHDEDEINLGLIGAIIVTDPNRSRTNGTPADVDREMIAWFQMFDETLVEMENRALPPGLVLTNASGLLPGLPRSFQEMMELEALGERATINGYAFGNLPGMDMNQGEKVRWHLLSLGGLKDVHSVHWHGNRLMDRDESVDVVALQPGSMRTLDMQAENPGTWLFQTHVAENMMAGMFAFYTVHPESKPVDTAPEKAFLGFEKSSDALRLGAARIIQLKSTTGTPRPTLTVEGRLKVTPGSSLEGKTVRVQLGTKAVQLKLNRSGKGQADGFEWSTSPSIIGANDAVSGDQMAFTWSFTGPDWERQIPRAAPETFPGKEDPFQQSRTTVIPTQLSWEGDNYNTLLRIDTVPR